MKGVSSRLEMCKDIVSVLIPFILREILFYVPREELGAKYLKDISCFRLSCARVHIFSNASVL